MKRVVRASNNSLLEDLMEDATKVIKQECDSRGQDEYPDDIQWGQDRFKIPVFVTEFIKGRPETKEVAEFFFVLDPDDDELSMEEQMHAKLDEFIQDWNYDPDSDDYTGQEAIEDMIDDVVFAFLEEFRESKSTDDIVQMATEKLEGAPYNLVADDDFDSRDILEAIDDYKYYWD